MKIKYEEKFIVINKKHLNKIKYDRPYVYTKFMDYLRDIAQDLPKNKYYICNQDEPYAQKVIDIILKGEIEKTGKIHE